jgi:hypothetical protein
VFTARLISDDEEAWRRYSVRLCDVPRHAILEELIF